MQLAAVAGISIIDRERLWWPSISTNSPIPASGWAHPRQIGFCSYTLLSEAAEVLVVEDASKDRRYGTVFLQLQQEECLGHVHEVLLCPLPSQSLACTPVGFISAD